MIFLNTKSLKHITASTTFSEEYSNYFENNCKWEFKVNI